MILNKHFYIARSKQYGLFFHLLCFAVGISMTSCASDPCSFNIDKHEILTGIDIPKTSGGACLPQEELGFKLSIWELDTFALADNGDYGSIAKYQEYFKFEPLEGELNEEKIALIPDVYQQSLLGKNLLYKSGERNGQKWIMILNPETGILFGEIIDLN